jgi:hypothetical protein
MTMLTHTHIPLERSSYSPQSRDAKTGAETDAAGTRLATIKRICLCACAALLAGGAMAGIIALRTAIYLARFNYH